MTDKPISSLSRRKLLQRAAAPLAIYALSASGAFAQTPRYKMTVKRDPGCGCCHVWAEIMEKTGRFELVVSEDRNMSAYKKQVGLPPALASCHTAIVEGYVIEGHVPAEDILRLIAERPTTIKGIAAPGMPLGSPGMEMPNGARDAYDVVAFHKDGRQSVFKSYAAKS